MIYFKLDFVFPMVQP